MIDRPLGCIKSCRDERVYNTHAVLKQPNRYEFIYDLKNSNSTQEFTGVCWLQCITVYLNVCVKKLLHVNENDQGSGWQQGIHNITIKD